MSEEKVEVQSLESFLSPEALLFMQTSSVQGGMPMVEDIYSITGKTKWFVIYTNPKCEERVKLGLVGKGFNPYMPIAANWKKQSKREKHMKQKKVRIERPALTRYVLVEMPAENTPFGAVRLIDGVKEILGDSASPLQVRREVVDKIKQHEDAGFFDDTIKKGRVVAPRGCVPGLVTSIKDGPFSSFMAIIQEVLPNDKVKVEAHIFGQKTFVTLELAQLERAW